MYRRDFLPAYPLLQVIDTKLSEVAHKCPGDSTHEAGLGIDTVSPPSITFQCLEVASGSDFPELTPDRLAAQR